MDATPFDKLSYLAQQAERHINLGMPAAAISDMMAAERIGEQYGIELRPWDKFLREQACQMELLCEFYGLLSVYHDSEGDSCDDSDLFGLFYLFKDTLCDLEGIIEVPAELNGLNLVFDIVGKSSSRYLREHVSNPVKDVYAFARAEAWFMKQAWYGDFMQRLGLE